jgi:type II secretory ATPase GspE/PulE/Tfp pilus assembly ATPase PilB-like protein
MSPKMEWDDKEESEGSETRTENRESFARISVKKKSVAEKDQPEKVVGISSEKITVSSEETTTNQNEAAKISANEIRDPEGSNEIRKELIEDAYEQSSFGQHGKGFSAVFADVLSKEELAFLETEAKATSGSSNPLKVEDLIIRKRLLPPDVLLDKLAEFFKKDIRGVIKDLTADKIDKDIFKKNMSFFIVDNIAPLKNGSFAISNPRLHKQIERKLYELGVTKPELWLAEARKISKALRTTASSIRSTPEELFNKIKKYCDEIQYAKAAHEIIHYAFQVFASDLHLERRETHGVLRLRVDGVMEDTTALSIGVYERVVGAIYQLTQTQQPNIQESGDGAFDMPTLPLQLRVSFYPSLYGAHNIVMRLLPKTQETPTGDDLGYKPEVWKHIVDTASNATSGLILYAGPTGSGKSSSLFALLSTVDTKGKKLLEVADPIEYQHMLGVQAQLAETEKLKWRYADALRSALRHDPDLLLVGEIRDEESAKIALDAARTGHLIFSTVHAETTWEVFDRLQDLGLDIKYLLSATKMIVAQRLLRRICKACFGNGCHTCRGTGYAGRFAIAEVLTLTDALREQLAGKLPPTRVRQESLAFEHVPYYMTLQMAAKEAIDNKLTTLAEAERVLGKFHDIEPKV